MSRTLVFGLGASAWLASACFGGGGAAPGAAPSCVEGESAACACEDGHRGASICQADGTMGACSCPSGGAGAGGGTSGGASGSTTTGGPGGGKKPPPGDGGSGASGGAPGEGGSGGVGGSGGDGGAGTGGQDAGQDAAAGTGAKDAGTDAGGVPHAGEAYAPCSSADQCNGDLECAAAPFGGGGPGYCTVRCRGSLGMMVADCPAPPSGTVNVSCAALSGLCQLGSCENADCPEGMKCHQQWVPSPPFGSTIYYCAYGS